MILKTAKAKGLAQLSYLLGDEHAGVAAVIDPRRDVDVYLEWARRHQLRIIAVLETHIHADFVSGSRELAERTGARIFSGTSNQYEFKRTALEEGQALEVGQWELRVLHTPGHSPEHISLILRKNNGGDPRGVFTGDTLFAGSVGRPDLASDESRRNLARRLFASIHEKLLSLGDGVLVYPGHGAGSPCGSNIGDRDVTTIGWERTHSPKLQTRDEHQFVEDVLEDLPEKPTYYSRMKTQNAMGPAPVGNLPHVEPMDAGSFRTVVREDDTVVVDTREIEAFSGGHIPGALNLALRDAFPLWAGWTLQPDQRIFLILPDSSDLEEVQRHLFRIGLENVAGYLQGGMRGWIEAGFPLRERRDWSVHDLRERIENGAGDHQLLDVRSDAEWRWGRIPGAQHIHTPQVMTEISSLDRNRPVVVYCDTGYRASLAASLLERDDFPNVHNVPGSMRAWRAAGYPVEDGDS